jgi:uncharacterized membrane protein YfcA
MRLSKRLWGLTVVGGFLLGFGLSRDAFVATATAIALIVDAAHLPVYLWTEGRGMLEAWATMVWLSAAVIVGTIAGRSALSRIPENVFRRMVSGVVLLPGAYMLARAFHG